MSNFLWFLVDLLAGTAAICMCIVMVAGTISAIRDGSNKKDADFFQYDDPEECYKNKRRS